MKEIYIFLKSWGIIILAAIMTLIFIRPIFRFLPGWFYGIYFEIFPRVSPQKVENVSNAIKASPSETSAVASTFAGTLGPSIALLAAFLTFIAFWIQYRANRIQSSYIKQQRFEDIFFRLLDIHKRTVDSMDIRSSDDASKIKATGNECFRNMHNKFKKDLGDKKDVSEIEKVYDDIQDFYKHDLHHYFRFIYHMLKFINNANIPEEEKFKYSSILRATLSAYELEMIFYNGLHYHGNTHLKPLMEYFSFLKNLDRSLLFNKTQMKGYHKLAFAASDEREILMKDWKGKNSKK